MSGIDVIGEGDYASSVAINKCFEQGKVLLLQRQYDEAVSLVRDALRQYPDSNKLVGLLTDIITAKEEIKNAISNNKSASNSNRSSLNLNSNSNSSNNNPSSGAPASASGEEKRNSFKGLRPASFNFGRSSSPTKMLVAPNTDNNNNSTNSTNSTNNSNANNNGDDYDNITTSQATGEKLRSTTNVNDMYSTLKRKRRLSSKYNLSTMFAPLGEDPSLTGNSNTLAATTVPVSATTIPTANPVAASIVAANNKVGLSSSISSTGLAATTAGSATLASSNAAANIGGNATMSKGNAAVLSLISDEKEFVTDLFIDPSVKLSNKTFTVMKGAKITAGVKAQQVLEVLCQKISRQAASYVNHSDVALAYTYRNGEVVSVDDNSFPFDLNKIKNLDKSFRLFIASKSLLKSKGKLGNGILTIPGVQGHFNIRAKSVGLMMMSSKKRWVVLSDFDMSVYENRNDKAPTMNFSLSQCLAICSKQGFDIFIIGEDKPHSFQITDCDEPDTGLIWEQCIEKSIENARESLMAALKVVNTQKETSGLLLCRRLNHQNNSERVLLWASLKAPSLKLSTALPAPLSTSTTSSSSSSSTSSSSSSSPEIIDLLRATVEVVSSVTVGANGAINMTFASNLTNEKDKHANSGGGSVVAAAAAAAAVAGSSAGSSSAPTTPLSNSPSAPSGLASMPRSASLSLPKSVTSADVEGDASNAGNFASKQFAITTPTQQFLIRTQTAQQTLKWVALIRHVTAEIRSGGDIFFEGQLKEVDYEKLTKKRQIVFVRDLWCSVQYKKFSKYKSAKEMSTGAISQEPLAGVSINAGVMISPDFNNIFVIKRRTIEAFAAPDAKTCAQWIDAVKAASLQAKMTGKPVLHEGYLFQSDDFDRAALGNPRYGVLLGDPRGREKKSRYFCLYNSHIDQHFSSPILTIPAKDCMIEDLSAWGDNVLIFHFANHKYSFLCPSENEMKLWISLMQGGAAGGAGLTFSSSSHQLSLAANTNVSPSSSSSAIPTPANTNPPVSAPAITTTAASPASKHNDKFDSLTKKYADRMAGENDKESDDVGVEQGMRRSTSTDVVAEAKKAGRLSNTNVSKRSSIKKENETGGSNNVSDDEGDYDNSDDSHGPQVRKLKDISNAAKIGNDQTIIRPARSSNIESTNTVVVVDNGSAYIKAGFANELEPSVVFPTSYPTAWKMKTRLPWISTDSPLSPGHKGNIDWDTLIHIWEGLFQKHLNHDPTSGPVLMIEPIGLTPKDRTRMIEIMFEQFEIPYLCMKTQSLMAAVGVSKRFDETACVVSWGNRLDIVPVVHGCILNHATVQMPVGGDDLGNLLGQLLVNEHNLKLDTRYILADIRRMKEKYCFVTQSLDESIEKITSDRASIEKNYLLHDGREVSLAAERFIVPEAMFDTSLLQLDIPGVHELVVQSIQKCPIDTRKSLFSNIVLAGSTTLFPGFGERLQKEVHSKMPTCETKVVASSNRKYLSWIGGSIFASQPKFEDHCQWLQDWFEFGDIGTI